jgi:hypothetical protein
MELSGGFEIRKKDLFVSGETGAGDEAPGADLFKKN